MSAAPVSRAWYGPHTDPASNPSSAWRLDGTTGGTICFMDKTTLYLPEDLKAAVKRSARERGVSEAEVIRESLRSTVGQRRPRPRGGLFASGAPIAREADEHLTGFGQR